MELGRFDSEMQQFVEEPKPVNWNRLFFERWKVDNNQGEHRPVGLPVGDLAAEIILKYHRPVDEVILSAKQREVRKYEQIKSFQEE